MKQCLGLEDKASVHILLVIAGAQPFWILMSVECEPCQSLDYAVHSFTNIYQCLFETSDN